MMNKKDNKTQAAGHLRHVSAKEAFHLLDEGAYLLDVRPEYELGRLFDAGNVLYLPYQEIPQRWQELPDDRLLIVADAAGIRSKDAAVFLLKCGLNNILHLAGGIVDWERTGLPVSRDRSRLLTGSCMCQLKVRNKPKP